jgi:hypothetical protein
MANRVADLVQRCSASRDARKNRYATLRLWYTRGSGANQPARYNKLEAHVELLGSYLYAPETTRFFAKLPANLRSEWREPLTVAADEFVTRWRDCGADVLFANIVEWALVYNSAFAKVLPDPHNDTQLAYIHPGDLGVLREDLASLDAQDVVCHWYSLTVPQIRRLVGALPDADKIVAWAEQHAVPGAAGESGVLPQVLQQVVVSNVTGAFPNQTAQGITDLSSIMDEGYAAVEEPLVEVTEVWERAEFKTANDERYIDYQVHTQIGDHTIRTRRNPVLPRTLVSTDVEMAGELPFIGVVPRPVLDYLWGKSTLASLVALQQWRESRMGQVDDLLKFQLDPSGFISGVPFGDEKLKALKTPGGWYSTPNPNAKIEQIKREMPQAAFEVLDRIDQMFADSGGLPEVLQGSNQAGIRAGSQVQQVAGIATSRVRRRALIVEDALEMIATRMFHLVQRHDTTKYTTTANKTFLMSQLPPQTAIKVSAHSSSPVYAEQLMNKADRLLKAGAIELADYVDLLDPPRKDELMDKARVLAAKKAQQMEKLMRLQELKATRRGK